MRCFSCLALTLLVSAGVSLGQSPAGELRDQTGENQPRVIEEVEVTPEPFIVAHRGASYGAPENTLPAFELAWKENADAIEGDFHLTSDGEIVCIHDSSTKKYCEQNLVVASSTLKQLRALDVGKYFDERFTETKIPTLKEVLATVPKGKKIYVEVKCGPEIVPIMLKQFQESGLRKEQIVVISFNQKVVASVESKRPELKTAWLMKFKQNVDPEGKVALSPTPNSVLRDLIKIKADGVSTHPEHVTEAWVREVQKNGFEYHFWTIDQVDLATQLLKWGAGSITTNVPGKMRQGVSDAAHGKTNGTK